MQNADWMAIARHTPLGILCDLDGTLVPLARIPEEARPSAEVVSLAERLAVAPGLTFCVISGRAKDWLEAYFPSPSVRLVAEHGAVRRGAGAWQPTVDVDPAPLGALAEQLEAVARRHPGALVERKTVTVALHYRDVRRGRRGELLVEAYGLVEPFLARQPGFERLEGHLVTEIRPTSVRKSSAVPWLRELAGPGARLLAIGDDVTDEDMFRAMSASDEAILVRADEGDRRRTAARWALDGPAEVLQLLSGP